MIVGHIILTEWILNALNKIILDSLGEATIEFWKKMNNEHIENESSCRNQYAIIVVRNSNYN